MNGAHWHLVVNHFPIIVPMVGLLIMIAGFLFTSDVLKRAAYGIFILGALSAFAASSTGEGAEEIVEGISGIDKRLIHVHEEAAEVFAVLLYILGGISLIGLWASFKHNTMSKVISLGTIPFVLVVLFFAKQTGTTGGEIRHTEIRVEGAANSNTLDQNGSYNRDDD